MVRRGCGVPLPAVGDLISLRSLSNMLIDLQWKPVRKYELGLTLSPGRTVFPTARTVL